MVKVRYGESLLYPPMKPQKSDGKLTINLLHKWSYLTHTLWKNYLIIETIHGDLGLIFTGEIPDVEFLGQEKDQLYFNLTQKIAHEERQ